MATALGYDTSVSNNLWKDRVNTEVNLAVLYSFNSSGVAIVDHHTLVNIFFFRINLGPLHLPCFENRMPDSPFYYQ